METMARLHGNDSMWNRTRTVRIGLAFTRELMEPFHTDPLAVPELVHLESRVPHGTEPKGSRANSLNRSRQVRLETRQGEIRLTIADDNWKFALEEHYVHGFEKQTYGGKHFFKDFSCS